MPGKTGRILSQDGEAEMGRGGGEWAKAGAVQCYGEHMM